MATTKSRKTRLPCAARPYAPYCISPRDGNPLKEGEKSAQVKLSLELHGVKATGDSGEVAANQD